ncbi:MAG: hypothetical protein KDI01_05980 [Halioglobus sp.]|nr:hypothetical protein [Halioglobus sp.]
MIRRTAILGFLLSALLLPCSLSHAKTYDVLELPAVPSDMASKAPLFSIARFFGRYYATGIMGHIIYSDDGGKSWQQAQVPVRSALLDIYFVTPQQGWAVGHEGVILHSQDRGETWVKQYDGLRYGLEGLAHYQKLAREHPDEEIYEVLVDEMKFAIEQGADKPLFKVRFHDENYGHALGAYGMALVTYDGGKHWTPNLETYENEGFYHIFDYAPLPQPNHFFVIGEAALFMVGDIKEEHAARVHSVPWEGSFFTSTAASDGAIVLGGLRGRMFRTEDAGQTWTVVEKPPTSALVASTRLDDGRLVFGGVAGEILISEDDGNSFKLNTAGERFTGIFDLVEGENGSLLIAGPKGIETIKLDQ